jgi:hypothetical protein
VALHLICNENREQAFIVIPEKKLEVLSTGFYPGDTPKSEKFP